MPKGARIFVWIVAGLVTVVAGFLGLGALRPLVSPYVRFTHRSSAYYTDLAQACTLVMLQHRPTTNDSAKLAGAGTLHSTIKLSGTDPTLPKIIRELQAEYVLVSTNRMCISGPGRDRFGVTWESDGERTNRWLLQAGGDAPLVTLYEQTTP
jgi:hypothetical protein